MSTLIWNNNARIVPDFEHKTIVFNNESGWQAKLQGQGLELVRKLASMGRIEPETQEQFPSALMNLLVEKRVLIEESTQSDYYANVNHHIQRNLNENWRLTILPTEKCNFDCYYCYEERVKGRMKSEVAEATDQLVRRFAENAPRLTLSFFGGEPMLAKDLVARFMKTAYEHAPNPQTVYGDITTNGSLITADFIRETSKHNLFHYQITLDGPRRLHNLQRPTKGGKETFDTVLQAFELLHQSDNENLKVEFRVNVHAHSAEQYLPLMDDPTVQKVLSDKRFYLHLHEIWGSDRYVVPDVDDPERAAENLLRVKVQMQATINKWQQTQPVRQFLNGTCGDACYAGKPNQYVIYPTGDIGKCTVILEEDRNIIGKLGPNGELVVNTAKHDYWIAQNALVDKDCQKCAYRISCAGIGCPLNRVKPGDGTCTLRNMYDKMWGQAIHA
ncbi:MAG: radical SAM protein [Acidobacteria bacterium]|nr:radical SAM protein [Acidobacteriota bacterium]